MKALIVEDDRILSNNICESLKHKFDMTQAFDGEEGLERLARESFDVIILDVMMPRLNGYEVLEQMRGGGITTPVLMLTALGQASDQVKGLRAGADDYLSKPCLLYTSDAAVDQYPHRPYRGRETGPARQAVRFSLLSGGKQERDRT